MYLLRKQPSLYNGNCCIISIHYNPIYWCVQAHTHKYVCTHIHRCVHACKHTCYPKLTPNAYNNGGLDPSETTHTQCSKCNTSPQMSKNTTTHQSSQWLLRRCAGDCQWGRGQCLSSGGQSAGGRPQCWWSRWWSQETRGGRCTWRGGQEWGPLPWQPLTPCPHTAWDSGAVDATTQCCQHKQQQRQCQCQCQCQWGTGKFTVSSRQVYIMSHGIYSMWPRTTADGSKCCMFQRLCNKVS